MLLSLWDHVLSTLEQVDGLREVAVPIVVLRKRYAVDAPVLELVVAALVLTAHSLSAVRGSSILGADLRVALRQVEEGDCISRIHTLVAEIPIDHPAGFLDDLSHQDLTEAFSLREDG